jgi:hypothetical protein
MVEFSTQPGLRQVSLTPQDAARRSVEALGEAMTVVHSMAARVCAAVESMAQKPSNVEVSFGIKFDAQLGAIVAKSGIEASLNVKLSWDGN